MGRGGHWGWLALVLAASCTGMIDDPTGSPGGGGPHDGPDDPMRADGEVADPAEVPLRRLTRRELERTITALVGRSVEGALDTIPDDSHDLVYDRIGAAQTVSPLHVET